MPGVWKFTKKMNGVQFTFMEKIMNGRSWHRSQAWTAVHRIVHGNKKMNGPFFFTKSLSAYAQGFQKFFGFMYLPKTFFETTMPWSSGNFKKNVAKFKRGKQCWYEFCERPFFLSFIKFLNAVLVLVHSKINERRSCIRSRSVNAVHRNAVLQCSDFCT